MNCEDDMATRLQAAARNLDCPLGVDIIDWVTAEIETLRQFINDLDIEVMQPHMNGHHQCKIRMNGKDLTPKQWAIVIRCRFPDEGWD